MFSAYGQRNAGRMTSRLANGCARTTEKEISHDGSKLSEWVNGEWNDGVVMSEKSSNDIGSGNVVVMRSGA